MCVKNYNVFVFDTEKISLNKFKNQNIVSNRLYLCRLRVLYIDNN